MEQKEIMEFYKLPETIACAVIPQMGEWTLKALSWLISKLHN